MWSIKPYYMHFRSLFFAIGLLTFQQSAWSQISITGPTCVTTGVQYTYRIGGNWTPDTHTTWNALGGVISGPTSGTPQTSLTVTWNSTSAEIELVTTNPSATVYLFPTVTSAGGPSVSISASSTSICAGSAVTFTASAANGGSSPGYQWQVNGANVSGATGSTYTTSSLTNGQTVNCVVTSSLACSVPATATSNTITMTVNPLGTMSVDVFGEFPICQGNGTAIHAVVSGSSGTLTYQWVKNGVNVTSDEQSIDPSVYETKLLNNGDVVWCVVKTSQACYNSPLTSNSVTAVVSTTLPFTASIAVEEGMSTTICQNASVTFSAVTSQAATYQWSQNGVQVPGATGATYTTTASSLGQLLGVTLLASASGGCPSNPDATASSAGLPLTITPTVGVPTMDSGPDSVCQASPASTYVGSASNVTGYTWAVSPSGAGTASGTGPVGTITWNAAYSGTATVSVVALGCNGPSAAASTTVVITPTVGAPSAPAGPASVCEGDLSTSAFTTSASNDTAGYTWSISPAGSGTISGTGPTGTVVWSPTFNGIATISVTALGCNGPSAAASTGVSVIPFVSTPSTPAGVASLCQNMPATVYTTSADFATGYNWSLTPAAAGTVSGSGTAGTVTWNAAFNGPATLSVTANGCNGPSAAASQVIAVDPLFVTGTISPGSVIIPSGSSPGIITLTAAENNGCSVNSTYSYQWQSSPDNTNWTNIGDTNLTYNPGTLTATVYYRVEVTSGTFSGYSNTCEVLIGTSQTDRNYIRQRTIVRPGITDTVTADQLTSPSDVMQATTYFDGLGRPIQKVAKQASPLQNDMVTIQEYDPFGRETNQYLPYTSPSNDGNYKTDAVGEQSTFNAGQFPQDQFYYGQVSFEPSPLNRLVLTCAAGNSWVGSNRGIAQQYLINGAEDSVQIWTIGPVAGSLPVNAGSYPAGQLYKDLTVDEAGHQVVEYKDFDGVTVLKKVQLSNTPGTGHAGWLNTYYVYDTLNNLRFVIPPAATNWLQAAGWTFAATGGSQMAFQLCFRYEYDYRNRMMTKKVPGAGQVWMVYDARDRLVMTQDSNLQAQGKWLVTEYDALDRRDSTGLMTDSHNQAWWENTAFNSTYCPIVADYPYQLQTATHYDNYSWVPGGISSTLTTTYTSNSSDFITGYNTSPTYSVAITWFPITRGQVTGKTAYIVGATNGQYMTDVSFYDDRGRVIQTENVNISNGLSISTTQYDFSGKPLRTLLQHTKNGLPAAQHHLVLTKLAYDQAFRLKSIYKNIDGAPADQLIDSMQYNELGQLRAKYLGNNVDSLVYAYNIRGWLTGINPNYVAGSGNNFFGMELGYDKTTSIAPGNSYTTPEYNGNIEGTVWKTAGAGINRKYDFSYDEVNRLTAANFNQYNGSSFDKSAGIDFSVSGLNYDANGNILNMRQTGFKVGGSSPIDILTYSYGNGGVSNQLTGVTDSANNDTTLLGDFHYNPATKQLTDYTYDGNGNLLSDNNKAIDSIVYNYLGLTQSMHMKGKGYIVYTYDATGARWKKTITDSLARHSTTISYIDGFVYQQVDSISNPDGGVDTLQFMTHEEGRVRWAAQKSTTTGTIGYSFQYDFFEKDHLGNTRMVLTQERDTTNYLASMEAAYRSTESQLFGNIASTCVAWTSMPNYQNIPNSARYAITPTNDSVSKVDYTGSGGQTTGPSLLLKVMSGDTVALGVQSYYNSNTVNTTNSSFTSVLNSLASGLLGTPTGAAEGGLSGYTSSTSPIYGAITSFLSTYDPAPPTNYPKAYLNWIFLDDQFNYVSSASNSVAAASNTYPAGQLNSVAPGGPVVMPRNGYLYVWVSNETQGWDVFFDNLSVQYKQGPVLEENHYYPFGLTMAGISDKAVKTQYAENKFRFNDGTELQNKEFGDGSGLELYDAQHRMYDPQLGRFGQADPLADAMPYYSPYSFGSNDPISHVDPFGLKDTVVTTKTTNLAPAYVYGHKAQAINYIYWPESTSGERRTWARNQGIYTDRVHNNQPLSQKGDPASYTASLDMYKRWTKEDQNYRAMQSWAVGIIAAPALLGAAPEAVAYGLDFEIKKHIGAVVVDATLQTVGNVMEHKNIFTNYNFVSGGAALVFGAPEGASLTNIIGVNAFNATLGTSVNVSYNSLFGDDHVLSFHPLSIVLATAFGTAGSVASGFGGGGNLLDAMFAPVNLTGQVIDSGTKPEEPKK